jgi:hypothetical protein
MLLLGVHFAKTHCNKKRSKNVIIPYTLVYEIFYSTFSLVLGKQLYISGLLLYQVNCLALITNIGSLNNLELSFHIFLFRHNGFLFMLTGKISLKTGIHTF